MRKKIPPIRRVENKQSPKIFYGVDCVFCVLCIYIYLIVDFDIVIAVWNHRYCCQIKIVLVVEKENEIRAVCCYFLLFTLTICV